jgi:thiopeptide-type bacteriocin biosynthesis protein
MSSQLEMPPGAEPEWHAWHLHLSSPARSMHDRVILDVVEPVVAAVAPSGFFFMRYWQAGPHVRLRMRGLTHESARRAESMLTERLAAAVELQEDEEPLDLAQFGLQAASLATAGEQGNVLPVEALHAAGVYRSAYEPELDRYGGAGLMPMTEQLFELSSRAVLDMLHQAPGLWTRADWAATAIAAAALALSGPEIRRAFCAHGVEFWRDYCANLGFPAKVIDQVIRSGERNGDRLTKQSAVLFRRAERGPVEAWAHAIRRAVPAWRESLPLPGGRATALSVLASHVHMVHNRLGLVPHEEMFNYVSLGRVLETAGEPARRAA